MTRRQEREKRKLLPLVRMIVAGTNLLTIILAVAGFAAADRPCSLNDFRRERYMPHLFRFEVLRRNTACLLETLSS